MDEAAAAWGSGCDRASGGIGEEMRKHRKLVDAEEEESHPHPEPFARSYQLEALEKAVRENTIVFLETGSGKTLIAVMLLRAYAHLIRKPSEYIAVFLVPTVVLVNQQAQVIEMHTDLKVGKFWGEMGVDFWNTAIWKEKLLQYEVFVMTPQILLDNLRHRFFKLEKIKLLIFDECHNARGRSPYACIMTEFYHRQLHSNLPELPRIFGMTASLVNSKGSNSRLFYSRQIIELESLMNSKVYTVASESILAQYIPFPTLRIKLYKHVGMPYDVFSSIADQLDNLKIKHLGALQGTEESARKKIVKLHHTFTFCLTELGVWSAMKAAESLSIKEVDIFFWGQRKDCSSEKIVRMFSQDAFHVFLRYLPTGRCIGDILGAGTHTGFLTAKVHCLIKSLLDYRTVHELRCIVFVERVITAIVLQSVLSEIKEFQGWGTKYMAGNQSGLQSQTRKEQIKIVDAFREGKVNIIVATQIIEEGLDVQSCNLVIRFDPSATVCSFIQSRGRARMQGSDYLLIIRSGDSPTLSKVANCIHSGEIMREESLHQASLPCKPLKSDMYDEEFYRVETTGAVVTLSSSVALIYFYCSRLPSDGYFKPFPRFVIDKGSNMCTLHLPKSCPIQTLRVEGKVDMLKQIACLEAAKKLHQIGALTDYLLSFDEAVEDDAQESATVGETYQNEQVIYFPGELVDSWSSFRRHGLYHSYRITLDQAFNYETSLNDILLVVKSDLGADLSSYSFSLEAERGVVTVNLKYMGVVHLNHEQVSMARRFQISVFTLLIHRDFCKLMDAVNRLHMNGSYAEVAYLLLPLIGGKVDWHCVKSACFSRDMVRGSCLKHCSSPGGGACWIQTLDGAACSCEVENSVVYTPHNGHFYCVSGILKGLNANSRIKLKGEEVLTYKKYFETRHGLSLKWENESLLAGRHLFMVRNFLLRRRFLKERDDSNANVELPPELCRIIMSPISISILYSFSFVPTIMHRIQCMLLAARLKKIHLDHCMQNVIIPATKILEAITTKKCQEEFSLESLETLGDSFLKFAASRHLFITYNHHHEGILSSMKERVISNASLCRLGCSRKLSGFIRTEQFDSGKWIIPGISFDSNGEKQPSISCSKDVCHAGIRNMKSKVIADSVEALIGAYLCCAGELAAFLFLEWLGVDIDFKSKMAVDKPILERPEIYVNIKDLELLLKYTFNDPSLLVEALTHGSYQLPDIPRCYQRLEFLGDAVLDHLITVHLYNKYPGMTPGLLTDLRSASVNNDCYAHAAVKAGLNKHILHASTELHRQMTFYLNNFKQTFSGSSYGWDAGIALPKVLGDVVESIAGAIYIDSRFNKEIVWESIRPLLEPIVSPETIEYHPVRELQELCSRNSFNKSFSMTSCDGITSITAEVEGHGVVYKATSTGANKKTAKMLAAKAVLKTLRASISGL